MSEYPWWLVAIVALAVLWCVLVVILFLAGRILIARELATLLPNLVRLFAALLRDPRVPLLPKLTLGFASVWLAMPIDLIPDFIPVVGSLDDAIVAALALRLVLATTDPVVVREHWHGDQRSLERLMRIALVGSRRPRV